MIGRFDKWGVLVGNGVFFSKLNYETPGSHGLNTFANPGLMKKSNANEYVATSIAFTEGNVNGERGAMIYSFSV